jgi:hypothetical protein
MQLICVLNVLIRLETAWEPNRSVPDPDGLVLMDGRGGKYRREAMI